MDSLIGKWETFCGVRAEITERVETKDGVYWKGWLELSNMPTFWDNKGNFVPYILGWKYDLKKRINEEDESLPLNC